MAPSPSVPTPASRVVRTAQEAVAAAEELGFPVVIKGDAKVHYEKVVDVLDLMAPGDAVRQSTELASTLTQAQQNPTSSNRLRHALALGAAGHSSSNPVEARRLITELLAGQHDLTPQEVSLANAFLREFDARVALYADLARQREESERQMKSIGADEDRRYSALAAAGGSTGRGLLRWCRGRRRSRRRR